MNEETAPETVDEKPGGESIKLRKEETNWALFAHLSGLAGIIIPFGNIFAPLVIWLLNREDSAYIDHHGREALNFQIAFTIYMTLAALSTMILIGIILAPIVGIAGLVLMIKAAIKASNGEKYSYPYIFRLVQ